MFAMRLHSTRSRLVRFPGDSDAHLEDFFYSVDAELFTGHRDVTHKVFPAHALVMLVSSYLNTAKQILRADIGIRSSTIKLIRFQAVRV